MRSLPKDLDEHYSRVLRNIRDEYSDYAVSILRWLTYAEKPMRLAELGEIIAVNLSGDPRFDADLRFPDPRDLLDISPDLLQVEVNESENPIVRLAHFSVKEYLISERIKTQELQKFSLPDIQSHELIAASCLAYILHFEGKGIDIRHRYMREKYPLMDYACWYWDTHARVADQHQGILKDLALEFLRRSDLRKAWFRMIYPGGPLDTREEELEYIPPLFIAASIGILGSVQTLLESGHDANERCALGTPLERAARQGPDTVLRILLEYGADPNLLGRDDYPPLQVAARFGTVESVKTLIDSGADMHDERGSFGSPLIAAFVPGIYWSPREKVVEFLLDKGVNIHLSSKKHGNALHAACAQSRANIALIEKLVSRGIEIDARGGKYGTPLQAACAHSRNDPVIRFLLSQADPCIEVKESKYGTALQAICAESHDNVEIVKMLLDRGAKKTARGGKYGTVLHAACYQNNEKIVRLLLRDQCLEKGIAADQNLDVNEVTAQYGTPLHAACRGGGSETVVRLLVELGANINAIDARLGTPLHAACRRGSEKIVRLLVELGANINANVPDLGTPLHLICESQDKTSLTTNTKLLLAKGADFNIRRNRQPYTVLEILLHDEIPLRRSCRILRILYEQTTLVETSLSRRDAIRLEEMKKRLGISTDGGITDPGRKPPSAEPVSHDNI